MHLLDKTLLDLISLLLSATGIFSVLAKFYVPQLNKMYVGSNPHVTKRDEIDSVTAILFIILAVTGVVVQAVSIVKSDSLPRLYSEKVYFYSFCSGLIVVILIAYCIKCLGRLIARPLWIAKVSALYSTEVGYLNFMVGNENIFAQDYAASRRIDKQNYEFHRQANVANACLTISDLEDIFEITAFDSDWKIRMNKLNKYLSRYYKNTGH